VNGEQRDNSKWFWLLLALIFVIFSLGIWAYLEVWLPNRALNDCILARSDEIGDIESLRKVCHKIISYPFGNHHDAFIMLEQFGNRESIPYLIRALAWQQMPDDTGTVVCTTDHCVDALRKLTGEDFAYSHSDWSRWWQQNKNSSVFEQ